MPSMNCKGGQTCCRALRVLTVTGAYPTEQIPHWGTFIKSQVDSLIAAGVQVEVIHPRPGPMPLRYAEAIARVIVKSLTGRFDVIHGHYGQWCLVARMQWTTPVVASFLGSDLLGTPSDVDTTRKSALVIRISQWLARRVDAVIVKSEQMRELTPSENVFVIPNGVDFTLFHPLARAEARAALGWPADGYYILFANDPRIPVKDFPLAQAAVARLHAMGVPAKLITVNGQAHASMVQYFSASNALLLTSIHEGSPNVVKEAMACNVPVVATDVGDVAQVIGHTQGCHVCPHDPDALAKALQEALLFPTATTGRTDIAHLESSAVAQQIIEAYEYATRRKAQGNARSLAEK
jgi:glycosyltransferase involved in cell wall biosynthesis